MTNPITIITVSNIEISRMVISFHIEMHETLTRCKHVEHCLNCRRLRLHSMLYLYVPDICKYTNWVSSCSDVSLAHCRNVNIAYRKECFSINSKHMLDLSEYFAIIFQVMFVEIKIYLDENVYLTILNCSISTDDA